MTGHTGSYPAAVSAGYAVQEEKASASSKLDIGSLFSGFVVLSVLLAPIRFGILDAIRPTTIILPPCALYLVVTQWTALGHFLKTRLGVAFFSLMGLLTLGHLLGNDFIEGYLGGDYSVLALESLVGIPLVLLAGVLIGQRREGYPVLSIALATGLLVHFVSIALMPPTVTYREYDRMSGLLMDPNILLLHIIPIFFLWQSFLASRMGLICGFIAVPAVVWATLQTLSRAGLAALLIGLSMQFLSALIGSRKLREKLWVLLSALGLGGLLLLVSLSKPEFLQNRLNGYTTRNLERINEAGSMLGDRMLWLNELENHRIADHLLNPAGMGYKTFQKDNAILPHNTFVDIYIIGGPAAMASYVLLFAALLTALIEILWQNSQNRKIRMRTVALLACLATEVMMLSSLSVLSWKINWLVLGLLLGAVFNFRPKLQT